MSVKRGAPAPAVVGSHFVKQYYGEVLSKKPVELHRFYKDESTFCHASGTKEEEPVSGLADIKAKIEHLGLGGATVDLGCGSVDAQPSEGDGVLLMVTGSITIANRDPRQFVQTFFLARQYQDNDRHNYFVRNDIFRFLDVLPEVVQGALRMREEDNAASRSAPAAGESPVETGDQGVAQQQQQQQLEEEPSFDKTSAAPTLEAASPAMPLATPAASPSPMLAPQAVAPASEALVVAVAGAAPSAASVDVPPAAALDNGPSGKASISKLGSTASPPPVGAATGGAPVASSLPPPAAPAPAPSPAPAPAPSAPPAPMTYASLAKSWATVAAVGGEAAAPSLGAAGGAPASSSSSSGAVGGVSGNGVPSGGMSNGSWDMPNAGGTGSPGLGSSVGESVMSTSHGGQQSGGGGGGGGANSRPSSSQSGKGQKSQYGNIPHHASPAVAASAAAAREAAAAGNGEILPATSLFVRKVDMTIDRDDMIAHFGAYGEVTGISMNPTRGYAFIDYRNNECVALALSTKEHYVSRKLLVVEERHSPMLGRNPRGEHTGGRAGRNGGRGRGSGGRDVRDGERGERRPPGGRGGRSSIGRGDRPDGSGPKEGGYKSRARAEPT